MRSVIFLFFIIFISIQGYAQWKWEWQNPLPQGNTLQKVYFLDLYNGWTVGLAGTIMTTNNGGHDWIVRENDVDKDLNDLFVLDENIMWAVGDSGTVLRSIDGGCNWDDFTIDTHVHLNGVFFLCSFIIERQYLLIL